MPRKTYGEVKEFLKELGFESFPIKDEKLNKTYRIFVLKTRSDNEIRLALPDGKNSQSISSSDSVVVRYTLLIRKLCSRQKLKEFFGTDTQVE